MNRFIHCPNGHYYSENLKYCPYCGSMAPTAKPFHQEEPWCSPSESIIDDDGHYYMLNSDRETASFISWSKEVWDIYHDYMKFYDWYIETSLDDAQEVKRQEAYFDTIRIKSNSASFCIPREIVYNNRSYPIVRIRSGAFAFCEISSITIPDNILYIEENAFFRCDGLKDLFIPGSVKDLANRSISQCKDLKTITWLGTTYENDIDEPFLFPDYKEKYAIIQMYNDTIDSECAEWFPNYFTVSSEQDIYDRLHQYKEDAIREMNKNRLTTLDDTFWYKLMCKYIDEYTMKIIERKQCYKYGLPEFDSNTNGMKLHHVFWKLKKAIIYMDYGLSWLTPEEVYVKLRDNDYYMWDD